MIGIHRLKMIDFTSHRNSVNITGPTPINLLQIKCQYIESHIINCWCIFYMDFVFVHGLSENDF